MRTKHIRTNHLARTGSGWIVIRATKDMLPKLKALGVKRAIIPLPHLEVVDV